MPGNLGGVLQLVGRLGAAVVSGWVASKYGHFPSAVFVGIGQLAFYFSFFIVPLPLSQIFRLNDVEAELNTSKNMTISVNGNQSQTAAGQVSVCIADLLNVADLDKASRLVQMKKLIKSRDRQFIDLFFNDMVLVVMFVLGSAVFSVVVRMLPNQELGHLGVSTQSPIISLTQALVGIIPVFFAVGKLYGEITFIRGRALDLLD